MNKFSNIFLLIFLLLGKFSKASHLMGGEITWQCIKAGPSVGRFVFTVKLYRDCNGIPGPPSVQLSTNAAGMAGGINCTLAYQNDISPQGAGCPTCQNPLGLPNAVEEFVYNSQPMLISGVPPVSGWFFYYTDCCRNAGITNLVNPGSGSFTLRAFMYPYNATNTNPCFDSSPGFAERPILGTCTRTSTRYDQDVRDEELDSVVFEWDTPLNNGFPGVPFQYVVGYSPASPLPSAAQNPLNTPATLNQNTGIVSFTSYTPGVFVIVIKVTAYKCKVKVAEIYREYQVALLGNCLIPDPATGTQIWNTPPDVSDLLGNSIEDTLIEVVAGDSIEIPFVAYDFEFIQLPGQSPQGQMIEIKPSSTQFGANFTDTSSGCLLPPCAILDPPPPLLPLSQSIQASLKWYTSCNHLAYISGCSASSNVYSFIIKVLDNVCPSPAVNFNLIRIKVVPPPIYGAPRQRCLDIQDDGTVKLTFLPPSNINTLDSNIQFKAIYIYRSSSGSTGAFSLIDSLSGFTIPNADTILTYLDLGANANAGPLTYYLSTVSANSCTEFAESNSDTLSTIFLSGAQFGTDVNLNWTPMGNPLPSTSAGDYFVTKDSLTFGGGVIWQQFGQTNGISYIDPIIYCDSAYNRSYRVEITDTSIANCISRSNISSLFLNGLSPAATINSNDTTLCIGQTLNLTTTLVPGHTYAWSTGATSPGILVSNSTSGPNVITYTVVVSNSVGCTAVDSVTVTFITCSGLFENAPELQFDILPNPATDHAVVFISQMIVGDVQLKIFDISGRLVITQRLESEKNTIQLNNLQSGIYQATLNVDGKLLGRKAISIW